jgi:phosphate transport system ATP-binding protein
MAMTEPVPREDAIQTDGLHVSFGSKLVLKDLTLAVQVKKLSVVIGRSGSGKTTLLRALNRLNECFPDCRTSGTVKLRMGNIFIDVYKDGIALPELRRRVGMVFQVPNVLPISIFKNVALPLGLVLGLHKNETPDRVEEALKSAHLWGEVKDRLKEQATTLSGGQQQRLCLARVLALNPDVLLLDEPTASLDFRAAMKIEELLIDLKTKYTVIAVSHSLSQARRLADVVLVLKEGQVARVFPSSQFVEHDVLDDLLEEVF